MSGRHGGTGCDGEMVIDAELPILISLGAYTSSGRTLTGGARTKMANTRAGGGRGAQGCRESRRDLCGGVRIGLRPSIILAFGLVPPTVGLLTSQVRVHCIACIYTCRLPILTHVGWISSHCQVSRSAGGGRDMARGHSS
jgi:hypothetical protein